MRLSVEGYKSIAQKRAIEVKGLTIIAGANSSGKSSFMQPFLILKQTLESNTDDSALVINGENTNLTESSQIFCNITKKEEFSIYIEYKKKEDDAGSKEESKVSFTYNKNTGFTASESSLVDSTKEIKILPDMNEEDILNLVSKFRLNDVQFDRIYNNFYESDFRMVHKISRDKPFLSLDISPYKEEEEKKSVNFGFGFGFKPNGALEDLAEKIIHIPGIRSTPERQYKIHGYSTKFQGRFDKYTASILYKWGLKEKNKIKELNVIINTLGLGADISAKKLNEAQVCVEVSRPTRNKKQDKVNLSDVGFGLSQVLPIIVALIESNNEHIIYIEQPEIHLHPKAQFKLAAILSDYVNKGRKMIIETHSSILIRGLQIEVAEGKLPENSVSLNWFTQDSDGATAVSEAMFDENGTFGDWPADFDDTYLDAESRYLDAVEKKLGFSS